MCVRVTTILAHVIHRDTQFLSSMRSYEGEVGVIKVLILRN